MALSHQCSELLLNMMQSICSERKSRFCFLFLQVLRCFTSLGARPTYIGLLPMTVGFPHSEISGSKAIWRLPETYRSHITSFIASYILGIHLKPLHSCKECCTPLYNFVCIVSSEEVSSVTSYAGTRHARGRSSLDAFHCKPRLVSSFSFQPLREPARNHYGHSTENSVGPITTDTSQSRSFLGAHNTVECVWH